MKKPFVKHYTTTIPAAKTIAEIHQLLSENGAQGIATEYKEGRAITVFFKLAYQGKSLAFRLPAKPQEVYNALFKDKQGKDLYFEPRWQKSEKIAWRICKTWLEAQMTLVNLEQAKIQEVFLPYLVVGENKTLYEHMEQAQFMLPSGE